MIPKEIGELLAKVTTLKPQVEAVLESLSEIENTIQRMFTTEAKAETMEIDDPQG